MTDTTKNKVKVQYSDFKTKLWNAISLHWFCMCLSGDGLLRSFAYSVFYWQNIKYPIQPTTPSNIGVFQQCSSMVLRTNVFYHPIWKAFCKLWTPSRESLISCYLRSLLSCQLKFFLLEWMLFPLLSWSQQLEWFLLVFSYPLVAGLEIVELLP